MSDSNQRINESSSIAKKEMVSNTIISFPLIIKISIGLGVFLTALDMTSVMVSIFTIQNFFGVSSLVVQLVSLSYLIVLVIFLNISKNLGENFTSKRIFEYGLVILIVGSVIIAISNIFYALIIGRIVQAIGSSAIMANANPLLTKNSSVDNEKSLIAWNNLIISIGFILGPIVGGIFVFIFGWQSVFLINIPFGIVTYLVIAFNLPKNETLVKRKKLDYYSIGLFTFFLLFVMYGIYSIDINNVPGSIMAIIFIIIGLYMFITFYFNSKKEKNPFINFKILNDKTLIVGFISTLLVYAIINMILYQLPILIQKTYNISALVTGLIIVTIPVSWFIVHSYSGKLADLYDPKNVLPVAFLGLLLNFIAFIITTTGYFYWFLTIPFTILLGILVGIITAITERTIFKDLPKNKQQTVRDLLFLTKTFGFALGIVISTIFLVNSLPYYVKFFGGTIDSWFIYIPSYQSMLLIGCAFAFIGMVIAFKGPRIKKELENNRLVIK